MEETEMKNKDEERTERLIEAFLSRRPAFAPDDIDVRAAERRVAGLIGASRPMRRAAVWFQRVAAVLVIPLLAVSVYLAVDDLPGARGAALQEVTVPCGTLSLVSLPDGSQVWLNGGSTLTYPVAFGGGRRSVALDGEAYFEVQSDAKNPFTVETEQMVLTATGTTFNVEAWPADSVTFVTMLNGRIDVAFSRTAPFTMEAGQRASYNCQTGRSEVTAADAYRWCAWKDGLTVFRDDPLSYVFKRLSRTFNVDIHVKNPEIASDLYRATFEDESLDEILRLLEQTAPIRFVQHRRERNVDHLYARKQIDVYKRRR
ncbi:MAG: DUF4974 domain-containing protein [Tannerella sp.]|jgi:ferric-dicitrate binding protein FerR (iron transport regulator)|nr:DUF4974 domain-containing protein [Tannerella sp.]